MLLSLSGATRLVPVVGDPIAQVKAPFGMTTAFEQRGRDMICVPMQVAVEDFQNFLAVMARTQNVDGLIVTVPHKLAAARHILHRSPRAEFLQSVNTIRRRADGQFEGDMFDGIGFVEACKGNGCQFEGRRVLLVGVGGAGTAIAHAVAEAGVRDLIVCDLNERRRDETIDRLRSRGFSVRSGANDPRSVDIVLNATPLGMKPDDPLPVPVEHLTSEMFVGDVITKPEVPALIAAARERGCRTSTGTDMFGKVRDLMLDYLLADGR